MASFFDRIANAQSSGTSPYFVPGNYSLDITGIKLVESKRTHGETFFVAECSVNSFDPREGSSASQFGRGDKVAWRVKMSQPSAEGNVKSFCLAVLQSLAVQAGHAATEATSADLTSEAIESIMSESGPALGVTMAARAYNITTRAGNPFTIVEWSAPAA